MKKIILSFLFLTLLLTVGKVKSQPAKEPLLVIQEARSSLSEIVTSTSPLNMISILNASGKRIQITDGNDDVYFKSSLYYKIHDQESLEIIRMVKKPMKIMIYENEIAETDTLETQGYQWKPMHTGSLLTIHRRNGRRVFIFN